jgi:hypothetical protein
MDSPVRINVSARSLAHARAPIRPRKGTLKVPLRGGFFVFIRASNLLIISKN